MPNLTTRDGTRLRYKELGEGRPVILIHGWPLSADSWDPIMMKLADTSPPLSQPHRIPVPLVKAHGSEEGMRLPQRS